MGIKRYRINCQNVQQTDNEFTTDKDYKGTIDWSHCWRRKKLDQK